MHALSSTAQHSEYGIAFSPNFVGDLHNSFSESGAKTTACANKRLYQWWKFVIFPLRELSVISSSSYRKARTHISPVPTDPAVSMHKILLCRIGKDFLGASGIWSHITEEVFICRLWQTSLSLSKWPAVCMKSIVPQHLICLDVPDNNTNIWNLCTDNAIIHNYSYNKEIWNLFNISTVSHRQDITLRMNENCYFLRFFFVYLLRNFWRDLYWNPKACNLILHFNWNSSISY